MGGEEICFLCVMMVCIHMYANNGHQRACTFWLDCIGDDIIITSPANLELVWGAAAAAGGGGGVRALGAWAADAYRSSCRDLECVCVCVCE